MDTPLQLIVGLGNPWAANRPPRANFTALRPGLELMGKTFVS